MYGSSLRIETRRPRALSSRPTLAAVMPFPREEVTPPVTKTYFAMGQDLRGFFECYRKRPLEARPVAAPTPRPQPFWPLMHPGTGRLGPRARRRRPGLRSRVGIRPP